MEVLNNEKIQVIKMGLEIENTGHVTNTYVIKDKETSRACVIDPAYDEARIKQQINNMKANLDSVIITHSHADHIAALAKLVEDTDAKVYIHTLDYAGLWDKSLNAEEIVQTKVFPVDKSKIVIIEDSQIISLGNTSFEVIHTPGHTKGAISLLDEKNNILYSGDTIFEKSYGRTDLATGSHDNMKESLNKLLNRFEDVLVLPGHGEIFNIKDSKRVIRLLFAYKG